MAGRHPGDYAETGPESLLKKLYFQTILKTVDYPFPSFKSPPLNEVSIGLQFEPLTNLRIPHIGLFWEYVRKELPLTEHAQPILGKDQTLRSDPTTGLPLPRVWFIDRTESKLMQLQTDRYNYNWRAREGADPYPHFEQIIADFARYWDALEKFLADSDIGVIRPIVCELSYINIFEQGKEWTSIENLGNIFRDFPWTDQGERFLPHPKTLSWAASFPLPDDRGALNVRLSPGKRVIDNQVVLQLDMAATNDVVGQTRESIMAWYRLAHEWIVKGFVDLTQAEIQKRIWEREA